MENKTYTVRIWSVAVLLSPGNWSFPEMMGWPHAAGMFFQLWCSWITKPSMLLEHLISDWLTTTQILMAYCLSYSSSWFIQLDWSRNLHVVVNKWPCLRCLALVSVTLLANPAKLSMMKDWVAIFSSIFMVIYFSMCLCSRSAADKLSPGSDMAERQLDSFGRNWMVAVMLLCNVTVVRQPFCTFWASFY